MFGHTARSGCLPALDPATAPGDVSPAGFFTTSVTLVHIAFARCLEAAGAPRPVGALGIAPNSDLHVCRFFNPRLPGHDVGHPPTMLERMESIYVSAGLAL